MRWVTASERLPIKDWEDSLYGVSVRFIFNKHPLSCVYKFRKNYVEVESGYGIGEQIQYEDLEWLDEYECSHKNNHVYNPEKPKLECEDCGEIF